MPPAPTISVLVPVYNGEAFLAECIESVLAQTRTDWELVILDNRSTDRTVEVARRYTFDPRVRVVVADDHVDVHGNHNRIVRHADPRSRFVKYLGADDTLFPTALEKMARVAERHPEVGVVSSYRLHGTREEHHGVVPPGLEVFRGRTAVEINLLGGPGVIGSPTTVLLRADLARAQDRLFDATFWLSDNEAGTRLLLESELGFVHEVLTFTRVHPGQLTCFTDRVNSYVSHAGRMLARHGAAVLGDRYRPTLRAWLRRYTWFLAKQRLKPRRWNDREFGTFHRSEISRILADVGRDAEAASALHLCLGLLPEAGRQAPTPGLGREHALPGMATVGVPSAGR